MGAFLFGGKVPKRAWAGLVGGLTPDVPMLTIIFTLMASGVSGQTIFNELYWQRWWQITNAVSHSFLLWGGLLLFGLYMRQSLLAIYVGSAFLHSCIDFLVHRGDAHMSFWPLTNYKFMSPVSYYESDHYGIWFSLFDSALGIVMALTLGLRFKNRIVRGLLALCFLAYLAFPIALIINRT